MATVANLDRARQNEERFRIFGVASMHIVPPHESGVVSNLLKKLADCEPTVGIVNPMLKLQALLNNSQPNDSGVDYNLHPITSPLVYQHLWRKIFNKHFEKDELTGVEIVHIVKAVADEGKMLALSSMILNVL